jgi:hypothetical protein
MKPAMAVTCVFWEQEAGVNRRARETKRRGQGDALFFLGPMGFPSLSVGSLARPRGFVQTKYKL